MLTQQYSEQLRRAVNLVWTAAADYRFEPRFLALRTDGAPDFYMNCVIGYVHKWFGDDMPARLFASWAGDVRQAMLDDLAWLALENAAYERELPQRPALEELRAAHAAEFFSMEYQLSRQEWMNKNQLVYTLQSARWKGVLGERPPALNPWEKKLARALACPGTLSADELERAIRDAFRTYLQFDGTVHKKTPLRLHFDERWAPLLTKLLPTEIVRTDDLAIGRSAHAGQGGMVEAANALRARLRSNEREETDRDYIESCFGRSIYGPQQLALIEQQHCTGNHLGCHLWFTRGTQPADRPRGAAAEHLAEQAAEQARLNRAAYARDSELYQSALLRLTEQIRNCMLVHRQPDAVPARQGQLDGARVWREPVLRILKDYGDRGGERRIFDYFAAGWNRDGLALRGAGQLLRAAPADKHLLILLTDASPDDSHKIPPTGKIPLSREYDGQAGVSDTADEVRALRRGGTRVAAVFMGESANVPNANAIYGRDLARIRRMDQLAAAAGRLIQDEIRELAD